jgi:predicted kinase
LLTVVDADQRAGGGRKPLVALARQYHVLPVAVVHDVPDAVAYERNALRPERRGMGPHVVARHRQLLRKSLRNLKQEGLSAHSPPARGGGSRRHPGHPS